MDAREKMITTRDGACLATESFGDSRAEPLLLSMGATASMVWWPIRFCKALAKEGFHVIRYDHRDTGRSSTGTVGEPSYTVSDLADDLFDIMDAYGLPRAHFVGMSLGGYLAQVCALRRPERVGALVLIGSEPVGGVDEPLPDMDDDIVAAFSALTTLDWSDSAAVEDFMVDMGRLCTGPGRLFEREATLSRVRTELVRALTVRSAFNHSIMEMGDIGAPRVQDIAKPILVLHGSHDPVLPLEKGRAIARHGRDVELMILEGAGHELHADDNDAMVLKIATFLREKRKV